MRELDKNTSYDLRDLNKSQLKEFRQECIKQGATNVFYKDGVDDFNEYIKTYNVQFSNTLFNGKWRISKGLYQSVNALTLFEPQLKIGDTFEYNGFVCEVKEKIEEKNWYRIIDRIGNLYFEKMPKERAEQAVDYEVKSITEITNKKFIKQLEENAL